MSLFFGREKKEAVLFSPLEGQLTFEGKPASGATLKLWIKWNNPKGESFTYTADENGFFKIPKHTGTYKEFFLAQIVIAQEITVEYKNEEYVIWTLGRTSTNEFGELGGQPINLTCELTNEIEPHRIDRVLLGTSCRWENILVNGEN